MSPTAISFPSVDMATDLTPIWSVTKARGSGLAADAIPMTPSRSATTQQSRVGASPLTDRRSMYGKASECDCASPATYMEALPRTENLPRALPSLVIAQVALLLTGGNVATAWPDSNSCTVMPLASCFATSHVPPGERVI